MVYVPVGTPNRRHTSPPRTIPLQAGLQKPLTPITTEGIRRRRQGAGDRRPPGGVYKFPGPRNEPERQGEEQHFRALASWRIHRGGSALPEPRRVHDEARVPDYLLAIAAFRPTRLRSRRARRRKSRSRSRTRAGISSVCPTWPTTPDQPSRRPVLLLHAERFVASRLKSADRSFRSSSPATCPDRLLIKA